MPPRGAAAHGKRGLLVTQSFSIAPKRKPFDPLPSCGRGRANSGRFTIVASSVSLAQALVWASSSLVARQHDDDDDDDEKHRASPSRRRLSSMRGSRVAKDI